ncbi:MAG: hypothetical protein IKG85_00165 [Clostridia bacterium]|nr:hypothetical protein [Clostridia bacterium]
MDKAKAKKAGKLKRRLVFVSFMLLFLMLTILSVDLSLCSKWCSLSTLRKVYKIAVPCVFFILFITALILTLRISNTWKGAKEKPREIKSVKNESLEYLSFFMSYLMPLIGYDTDDPRRLALTGILILLFAVLFYKTGIYYKNPVLAVLGYKLYKAEFDDVDAKEGVIILSKDELKTNSNVAYIMLDEYVWIAKEVK